MNQIILTKIYGNRIRVEEVRPPLKDGSIILPDKPSETFQYRKVRILEIGNGDKIQADLKAGMEIIVVKMSGLKLADQTIIYSTEDVVAVCAPTPPTE
jgi:co-chaperonin GroES (HSP10)